MKEAGYSPRITVNTCWDDCGPFPSIYGCKVIEWGNRPATEYLSLSEHQELIRLARSETFEEAAKKVANADNQYWEQWFREKAQEARKGSDRCALEESGGV